LSAEQGGARKGRLECDVLGERVVISGKAALYMSGTLHL
ncbi:isomerase, partial [Pseudomonas aeruginosa]